MKSKLQEGRRQTRLLRDVPRGFPLAAFRFPAFRLSRLSVFQPLAMDPFASHSNAILLEIFFQLYNIQAMDSIVHWTLRNAMRDARGSEVPTDGDLSSASASDVFDLKVRSGLKVVGQPDSPFSSSHEKFGLLPSSSNSISTA
jgi:hypothetical protein